MRKEVELLKNDFKNLQNGVKSDVWVTQEFCKFFEQCNWGIKSLILGLKGDFRNKVTSLSHEGNGVIEESDFTFAIQDNDGLKLNS